MYAAAFAFCASYGAQDAYVEMNATISMDPCLQSSHVEEAAEVNETEAQDWLGLMETTRDLNREYNTLRRNHTGLGKEIASLHDRLKPKARA